jgi:hypothetical protein
MLVITSAFVVGQFLCERMPGVSSIQLGRGRKRHARRNSFGVTRWCSLKNWQNADRHVFLYCWQPAPFFSYTLDTGHCAQHAWDCTAWNVSSNRPAASATRWDWGLLYLGCEEQTLTVLQRFGPAAATRGCSVAGWRRWNCSNPVLLLQTQESVVLLSRVQCGGEFDW